MITSINHNTNFKNPILFKGKVQLSNPVDSEVIPKN